MHIINLYEQYPPVLVVDEKIYNDFRASVKARIVILEKLNFLLTIPFTESRQLASGFAYLVP